MSQSGELSFPVYQAVVTARFPSMEAGIHARNAIASLPSGAPALVVQLMEDTPLRHEPSTHPSGFIEAGVTMIVHLPDPERSEAIIRLCTEAGATRATFYAAQSVTKGPS
jgi:hypothetical protein